MMDPSGMICVDIFYPLSSTYEFVLTGSKRSCSNWTILDLERCFASMSLLSPWICTPRISHLHRKLRMPYSGYDDLSRENLSVIVWDHACKGHCHFCKSATSVLKSLEHVWHSGHYK